MTPAPPVAKPTTVLVVDDEAEMRELAGIILERGGLTVVDEASDGIEALDRYLSLSPPSVPSVVLLDNRMPGLTGLEVAERMLAHHPDQLIVLFTAFLDDALAAEAKRIGITACISKTDAPRLPELIKGLIGA